MFYNKYLTSDKADRQNNPKKMILIILNFMLIGDRLMGKEMLSNQTYTNKFIKNDRK